MKLILRFWKRWIFFSFDQSWIQHPSLHRKFIDIYILTFFVNMNEHGQGKYLHDELDLRNADNFDKPIIALLGSWAVGSADVV